MTTTMMAAPATSPASLCAFGTDFINVFTAAGLMGPLVPSDGTNYATEQEKEWQPLEFQKAMGLEKPLVSTLWSGIGDRLPPAYRALPMLFKMPGAVPPSHADMEAQERMEALHQSNPIGWVENLGDGGKLEDGRPSFYNQLSFFRKVVELTQESLANESTSTSLQKIVSEVDLTRLSAIWLRSDEYTQTYYDIVSAAKRALSGKPARLIDAADGLATVSTIYREQGFLPLSAIALEAAINLYTAAKRGRTWQSSAASYLAAQDYRDELKMFQDREQDPLGYDTMLNKALSITMNEVMYSMYASGPRDDRFLILGRELAEISSQSYELTKPKRAAEDKARILWLKTRRAHEGIGAHWDCTGDVIGDIAALFKVAGESEDTVAAINSWAESAYKVAEQLNGSK